MNQVNECQFIAMFTAAAGYSVETSDVNTSRFVGLDVADIGPAKLPQFQAACLVH